ncbi:uncharacterized protein V1518DRAFT_416183 [Limtongia smithiae]|uniref:uncharacterized protein n=1 Tax=Limtongia smithiae TaxID=1125753 RepID=UPI0034CDB299
MPPPDDHLAPSAAAISHTTDFSSSSSSSSSSSAPSVAATPFAVLTSNPTVALASSSSVLPLLPPPPAPALQRSLAPEDSVNGAADTPYSTRTRRRPERVTYYEETEDDDFPPPLLAKRRSTAAAELEQKASLSAPAARSSSPPAADVTTASAKRRRTNAQGRRRNAAAVVPGTSKWSIHTSKETLSSPLVTDLGGVQEDEDEDEHMLMSPPSSQPAKRGTSKLDFDLNLTVYSPNHGTGSNTGRRLQHPESVAPLEAVVHRKRGPRRITSANKVADMCATITRSSSRNGSSAPKLGFITNMPDLDGATIADGALVLKDGTKFSPNDFVYLVSEPPSEPYYIGRIMEFAERDSGKTLIQPVSDSATTGPRIEHYQIRVNWFYRPKDIPTRSNDSRLLFATMHCDWCPLLAIRGKCVIKHREHIRDLTEYRRIADHFWCDKLYDRYICRFYELLPTEKILNIPPAFAEVLRERVKFGVVEVGRGKDLCTAARNCTRCGQWCPPDESVSCAVCGNHYHMSCVRPPLLRKPTRGFAWACAICSREQERKMRESKGRLLPEPGEEPLDDEMDDSVPADEPQSSHNSATPDADDDDFKPEPPPEFKVADDKLTNEQLKEMKLWPYRYLGIHCKLEEVLDNNDRIFPRAVSRIGNKHQAVVPDWGGRPVQYIERTTKSKKKKPPGRKRGPQEQREASPPSPALQNTEDLDITSPWVHEKPSGYIERGGDSTVTLRWKMPPSSVSESIIDSFLESIEPYAAALQVLPSTPNLMDDALAALMACNYDPGEALKIVATFTRKSIKEPTLSSDEIGRFEDGVRKFGSELHPVFKGVKTATAADVVRYYYLWKKTPKGHEIWDNYPGRRGKKDPTKAKAAAKTTEDITDANRLHGLVDLVADSADDSCFDMKKVAAYRQIFTCKFCHATKSRAWRRAPGFPVIKTSPSTALCIRCAELWRRYAVIWEDPAEVLKKSLQRSSHGQKRKVEEELLREMVDGNRYESADEEERNLVKPVIEDVTDLEALVVKEPETANTSTKLSRKPRKQHQFGDADSRPAFVVSRWKVNSNQPVQQQIIHQPTQQRRCAVCGTTDLETALLRCHGCHMLVHPSCYGVREVKKKWLCDPCVNDRAPEHSMTYDCALCPATADTVTTHAIRAPREALKVTSGHNWVHVLCAVWIPELKFTDAYSMREVEGIGVIPKARFMEKCDICQQEQETAEQSTAVDEDDGNASLAAALTTRGACTSCAVCHTPFHVGCAFKAGYKLGFDVQPVKSSRRDSVSVVKLGTETGAMTPMIWCARHDLRKFTIHDITELSTTGVAAAGDKVAENATIAPCQTALNVYTQTYKQADTTLTGAARRAQQAYLAASKFGSGPSVGPTVAVTATAAVAAPTNSLSLKAPQLSTAPLSRVVSSTKSDSDTVTVVSEQSSVA